MGWYLHTFSKIWIVYSIKDVIKIVKSLTFHYYISVITIIIICCILVLFRTLTCK